MSKAPQGSVPDSDGAAVAGRDDDGRFRVLSSDEKYRGKIFSVRVDTLAMPGGGSATREIVDHMRAVGVLALDEEGRVVLIEQYRHPLRRRLWELPAGLMDIDAEPPLACAQRELAEEAGLAADDWQILVDLATSPGFCDEAIRVFLARGLRDVDAPPREHEEADLRVVRIPLDDAVDAVFDGRIVNATAVAGILAASRLDTAGGGHRRAGRPVRTGADDRWADGESVVHRGPGIASAPPLHAATVVAESGSVSAGESEHDGSPGVADGGVE